MTEDVLLEEAWRLYDNDQFSESKPLFESALQTALSPDDKFDVFSALSCIAMEEERWEDALSYLEPNHADDPDILTNLAHAYARLERYEDALVIMRRMVDLGQGSVQCLLSMSGIYTKLNKPVEREAMLLKARQDYPDDSEVCISLGNYYASVGDYWKACNEYQNAMVLGGSMPRAIIPMIWCALSVRTDFPVIELADSVADNILEEEPDNKRALHLKAWLQISKEQFPAAYETLNSLLMAYSGYQPALDLKEHLDKLILERTDEKTIAVY